MIEQIGKSEMFSISGPYNDNRIDQDSPEAVRGIGAASGAEYLLVEDNVWDAEIALFDLGEHGIANNFHIARNGAEALDYLFAEDGSLRVGLPKAIFLDLHMPKINGLEFLQRIKSDEQTKRIPVVVLKSSTSPSELHECQQLGAHSFIVKPLKYEDVINVVKDIDDEMGMVEK